MNKIFFQTQGCSTNLSESEIMMGILEKAGFIVVKDPKNADLIVINVCTVKGEFTALRGVRKIKEEFPKKKLVLSGCITPELTREVREITEDASLVSTHNITNIVEVIEEALQGNVIEAVSYHPEKKINLPRIRKNPVVGIVNILSGCNNECSYCSVRLVKGKLESYPKEEILKEVKDALAAGCKEIWVTSQDNAAYGTEEVWRSALPELLKEILSLNADFKIRIGMMNIRNLKPIMDEMVDIFKNDRVFKFLHVPLQSGSDAILDRMKRKYSLDEFKEVIRKFRQEIPHLTFATDIIAGFPGETEEHFNESLSAIRDLRPEIVNISRFVARPNTEAFTLQGQVNDREIKRRTRIITSVFTNLTAVMNEEWVGWKGEILIDEKGKDDSWIGRNFAYKQVIIKGNYALGQTVTVIVKRAGTYDLRAEEISKR